MRTLTVRLPEPLVAEIEAEAEARRQSKSDVVRERLSVGRGARRRRPGVEAIADLIGAVDRLPGDLSARTKAYLESTGYGRNRHR